MATVHAVLRSARYTTTTIEDLTVRKTISDSTKIAAVQALESGEKYSEVCKRFKIKGHGGLYLWRKQYAAGKLLPEQKAKANGAAPAKEKTRDYVREAVSLLRQAQDEVERLKQQGTIKEADTAHLYAGLALRILEGDSGR